MTRSAGHVGWEGRSDALGCEMAETSRHGHAAFDHNQHDDLDDLEVEHALVGYAKRGVDLHGIHSAIPDDLEWTAFEKCSNRTATARTAREGAHVENEDLLRGVRDRRAEAEK